MYFWPIWLNFQNGTQFGFSVTPIYQNLTEPFQPLGITINPGKYNYWQNWLIFTSDPSKILSLSADYKWGTYFNGKLQSGTGNYSLHPFHMYR